jgi:DNA repair protein RadC
MENYTKRISIREWAEDDRPREKLLMKGRHSLSDAELLAILIGSGTREQSAVEIARDVLQAVNDNLGELAKATCNDLMKHSGIGEARAITIMAALELGKRRNGSAPAEKEKILRSRQVYEIFRSLMSDQPYEEFWILMLNRGNQIVGKKCISEGGISGTVVDPKKIFKIALDHHASSIILGHNHPSGGVEPSDSDNRITLKVAEAGKMLEIAVLDHVIVGDSKFYSYADEGKL